MRGLHHCAAAPLLNPIFLTGPVLVPSVLRLSNAFLHTTAQVTCMLCHSEVSDLLLYQCHCVFAGPSSQSACLSNVLLHRTVRAHCMLMTALHLNAAAVCYPCNVALAWPCRLAYCASAHRQAICFVGNTYSAGCLCFVAGCISKRLLRRPAAIICLPWAVIVPFGP